MAGIFAKLRVIALGNIHSLLDEQIDMNSIPVLEQYIRDIEQALDGMRNEAAVQAGGIRTFQREIGDMQHRIETETELVKKIMAGSAPNKETVARSKSAQILQWQKELPDMQAQFQQLQTNSAEADKAVAALDAKHAQMINQLRSLKRTDAMAKAQEHSAAALTSASKLVNGVNGMNVDDLQARIQGRAHVAQEKFERAMGGIAVTEDATQAADVDAFLASLK